MSWFRKAADQGGGIRMGVFPDDALQNAGAPNSLCRRASTANSPPLEREDSKSAIKYRYYGAARQMIPNGMNSPSERSGSRNASSARALATLRLIIPLHSHRLKSQKISPHFSDFDH